MIGLNRRLARLEKEGRRIAVSVVGAGQMGTGLVSQTQRMKAMQAVVVVDIDLERARQAYLQAGVDPAQIVVTDHPSLAAEAIASGRRVATPRASLAVIPGVDAVVDATGEPEVGSRLALDAILAKKHIIMLNVEADVTVGPLLSRMAGAAGVVYTGTAGDEPGCIKELYDFADGLGFQIRVAGKGKNNPLRRDATPDDLAAEAKAKGASARMLTSFVDGTKTMVEMTCLANATGLLPDIPGMHGPEAKLDQVLSTLRLKTEGGVLGQYGVVEYVQGIAPGVFVVVTTDSPIIAAELQYLSMGPGPNFLLYRPYHLTSLETPVTIVRAVLDGEATIEPLGAPLAETIAVAKRDLQPGEVLDGLGGSTVYGTILTAVEAGRQGALPLGLVNHRTVVSRAIPKGSILSYHDVSLDNDSTIVQLRRLQDSLFAEEAANLREVLTRAADLGAAGAGDLSA